MQDLLLGACGLTKCLSWFIMEAHKENGEHYPPKSIHLILMGLQRFIREKQVIRVQKLVGLPPPTLELLGVFLRFRITFAEVITFSGASAHEF